jgi:hypothetical protein
MLKRRSNLRITARHRAMKSLSEIEATVAALKDEDLLDLADILLDAAPSPLSGMTSKQMEKRNLQL